MNKSTKTKNTKASEPIASTTQKVLPIKTPLDLSYANAATLILRTTASIKFYLVGCGGTGAYVAQTLARIIRVLNNSGQQAEAYFIDPDVVEEKNLGRQFFCDAEIGQFKATALANRYGLAWGVPIHSVTKVFSSTLLSSIGNNNRYSNQNLSVYIGCVDNAAARRAIDQVVQNDNYGRDIPYSWWLDCGNHADAGQVLLGSSYNVQDLLRGRAFTAPSLCCALPSPSIQRPDLLIPKLDEIASSRLSCAELTAFNLQSLMINVRVAAEAADFLTRMFATRNLKRFATDFDSAAGSSRSLYITPENIRAATPSRIKGSPKNK